MLARACLVTGIAAACALWGAAAGAQSFLKNQPPRIDAVATASTPVVSPGDRLTVEIRVSPRQKVHVYAPDNPEYIPVSVSFTATPGLTFGKAQFPEATEYFFAPLAEVVKVYSEPFTITQPVTVQKPLPHGSMGPAGRLVMEGTVRYQACDDRVCFPPQTVRVSASVIVGSGRAEPPAPALRED